MKVYDFEMFTTTIAMIVMFIKTRQQAVIGYAMQTLMDLAKSNMGSVTPLAGVEDGTMLPNAIIGMVDIASSAQISNSMNLKSDFQFKNDFMKAAAARAFQCRITILHHTGDGFLFLANHENADWEASLIQFHKTLIQDFETIFLRANGRTKIPILSGLRFGVSSGPVMIGSLGGDPAQCTAIGPDVNLAARLCAKAKIGEIVLSNSVWDQTQTALASWNIRSQTHHDLKGFSGSVLAIHAHARRVS